MRYFTLNPEYENHQSRVDQKCCDDLNRLEQALRTVKDILGKAEIESYAFEKYPDYDVTYAYSSAFHGIARVLKDLDDKLDEMNRMWEMPTDINETIVK